MKWDKYTIKTTTEAVDLISSTLAEMGVQGIEIEDKVALSDDELRSMFVDIPLDKGEDDGCAYISFYLEDAENAEEVNSQFKNTQGGLVSAEDYQAQNAFSGLGSEEIIKKIIDTIKEEWGFMDLGELSVVTGETSDDAEWSESWKKYFKPFVVDDIVIKPTWEDVPEGYEDNIVVNIDPGMAFGTGTHETTRLCITQIKKYADKNGRLIDIGCGSAILSIIAQKLGVREVVAVDVDEYAVRNAAENFEVNEIPAYAHKLFVANVLEAGDDAQAEALKQKAEQSNGVYGMSSRLLGAFEAATAKSDTAENGTHIGNLTELLMDRGEGYEIVVANILADVIIPLSAVITDYIKVGGVYITSGILETRAEDVRKAIAANDSLEILEMTQMGEWVSFTARRVK